MFAIIADDLEIITRKTEKTFRLKAGHIDRFLPELGLAPLDRSLRPALLLLSSRLSGGAPAAALALGQVVQSIFLAQVIHNRIADGGPKDLPQFPVLIGDYLYSKYFQLLSENQLLIWLAPLAQTICRMNEGGIRRYLVLDQGQAAAADYCLAAEEEEGLLLGLICRIGCLEGGREDLAESLEKYGRNLGIAWGIIKGGYPVPAEPFLTAARDALPAIPAGPERDDLLAILEIVAASSAI